MKKQCLTIWGIIVLLVLYTESSMAMNNQEDASCESGATSSALLFDDLSRNNHQPVSSNRYTLDKYFSDWYYGTVANLLQELEDPQNTFNPQDPVICTRINYALTELTKTHNHEQTYLLLTLLKQKKITLQDKQLQVLSILLQDYNNEIYYSSFECVKKITKDDQALMQQYRFVSNSIIPLLRSFEQYVLKQNLDFKCNQEQIKIKWGIITDCAVLLGQNNNDLHQANMPADFEQRCESSIELRNQLYANINMLKEHLTTLLPLDDTKK